MFRKRFMLLAVACSLGLTVGCQSLCDHPWLSRFTSRGVSECCEGDCCSPTLIYDGPVLPEGGPLMVPAPNGTPLPPPTPIPPGSAPNARLVPQPPQSQPIPYAPPR